MKIPGFSIGLLLLIVTANAFAQEKRSTLVCKQPVFAAYKPLPKLEYECPEGNDYDDAVLKAPARLKAVSAVIKELSTFTNPSWWAATTDDLNACEIHGSAGALTDEEKQKVKYGDYAYQLFGNHELRLALLADPCYSTNYNGSIALLLYRKAGQVFVSTLLNGYYSRVDNSVGIDFAKQNGEQLIEVSTANSMPPSFTDYYFAIDPKTNKALPKKLFKDGKKLTNEIYSAMLMNEPKDLGLPKNASELQVFSSGRLAPSFSAYEEDDNGRIDSNGRKLRRIVYRWNGKFYVPTAR